MKLIMMLIMMLANMTIIKVIAILMMMNECHLVKGIDQPIVWLFYILKIKLWVDNLDIEHDDVDQKDDDEDDVWKEDDLVPYVGYPSARHERQEDSVGDHIGNPEVNMGPVQL